MKQYFVYVTNCYCVWAKTPEAAANMIREGLVEDSPDLDRFLTGMQRIEVEFNL